MTFYERRAEWERNELRAALTAARWRLTRAAIALGMNRTHLYKKCIARGVIVPPRREARRGSWATQGL